MRLSVADLVVVVVAIFAAHRGWRRGLLAQVFELGGGFLGLLGGVALGPRIAAPFAEEAGIEAALLSLLAVVLGLSLGQGLGYVIGHRFGHAARRARLGGVDSGLGALFGAGVILLSYWLIGSLLLEGPIRPVARSLKNSALLRALNEVSAPPDVLAYLRQYLVAADFPQVFVGIPPSNEPVPLPRGRLVRRAIAAADQSTVRVMTPTPACGGNQLGNVVLFDPATDIAVIRVDGLAGPALELSTEPLTRGARGAILGYPGSRGGRLAVGAAAVQARFQALGRDIYGAGTVRREVYELRAAVEEGESGGPFVRPDGRVAGTVFAASTTDATVGYALTGDELADEVEQGARNTEPVPTGDCTR